MKRIILVLVLGLLVSCQKDNLTPTTQETQDCNCDRVVSSSSINFPDGSSFGYWSTVNDCTNQTVNGEWYSAYGETKPVVGTCK